MTDEQREQRLVYRRKYDEERRNWLDNHGMCHKCGKRKVLEGRKFCPVCIEKNVVNCMKKYQKKPESERIYNGRPYSERRKELYRQKRENGICVKCTNKATHGRLCWECFRKCKKINDRRLQKQKDQRWNRGLIPEYRKEKKLYRFLPRLKKYTLSYRQNGGEEIEKCVRFCSEVRYAKRARE